MLWLNLFYSCIINTYAWTQISWDKIKWGKNKPELRVWSTLSLDGIVVAQKLSLTKIVKKLERSIWKIQQSATTKLENYKYATIQKRFDLLI
jgi:hypothetical protein